VGDQTTNDAGRVRLGELLGGGWNSSWKGQYLMKLLIAGLLAFTGAAFAADLAPVSYHDGALVSFPMQGSGSKCTGNSEPACGEDYQAQYMVRSEGILYTLTPVSTATGSIAERATLGWSKAFGKNPSLYRQLPGTPLHLRDDGRHVFVRVGNRESMYTAIEVR
jgi:hypothetical protein